MSFADNKARAREFFEAFDRRAYDAIPRLFAPGQLSHLPGAPHPLDWPAHQQYASAFVAAFHDCRFVIEDQLADADNVVTRITLRGTHDGPFMGIPATGRPITMGAISWFRMAKGLIAEEWTHFDRLGMMVQIGVVPAPPTGGSPPEGVADQRERVAPLTDPRAIVGRWFERVDRGGVPDVDQYVASGYADHNPPPFPGLGPGITGVRQVFPLALQAFSEFHHEIEASFAEGDKVASRVTGFGKHTGEFVGIPATAKQVRMGGISIHRIQDGKLAEHWAQIDAMSLLQQMGAIPG